MVCRPLYRDWALQHADWAATGSLRAQLGKGTLPAWAATTPFCTRGNGNCEYPQAQANLVCADKMTRLQTLLGGVPLAMHWYGWNAEDFDTKYPHYTALPGVAAEVAKLRSAGIRVFPYTNGRLYDPSLPEWSAEGAISASCGCFLARQFQDLQRAFHKAAYSVGGNGDSSRKRPDLTSARRASRAGVWSSSMA